MAKFGFAVLAVVAIATVGWKVKPEIFTNAFEKVTSVVSPENGDLSSTADALVVENTDTSVSTESEQTLADDTAIAVTEAESLEGDAAAVDPSAIDPSAVDMGNVGCNEECADDVVDTVLFPFELSDEEFEEALVDSDALAARLREDPSLRNELIEIAVYAQGNKRSVIIAAFQLLDYEDRYLLASALSTSPHVQQRLDGVQLFGNPENINKVMLPKLSEILLLEESEYVRGAAVIALNKPDVFYGDQEVLDLLSTVILSEPDEGVRGEALLASVNLSTNEEEVVFQSFEAIRSGTEQYSAYGAMALDEMILRQTANGEELNYQTRAEIEVLIDQLMEPEYDNVSDEVRLVISDIVDRHFY